MKKAFFNYTGYGKTKIVLDYIMSHPEIKRTLIISKKDIIREAWNNEINKWHFPFTYTYVDGTLTQKEKLNRLYGNYNILGVTPGMLKLITENKFYKISNKQLRYDLVVFDESDIFKNSQTVRFKFVKKWINEISNVFILTATPMPNTLEDLWSQIYLIDKEPYILGKNITAFRRQYAEQNLVGNRYVYTYLPAAINSVINKIASLCEVNLVKPKNLYPQPKIKIIKINPDPKTAEILLSLKKQYVALIDAVISKIDLNKIDQNNNLIINSNSVDPNSNQLIDYYKKEIIKARNYNEALMKLQQISNGFIFDKEGNPLYLNDIKFKYIINALKNSVTPLLITYTFRPDKNRLLSLPCAKLVKSENEWNQNKIKLGVIYYNKAGLNLQHSNCQKIIWYSPTWDARAWEQTNSRVIRKGLKHEVTIEILMIKGSIEELMYEKMKYKLNLAKSAFMHLEGDKNVL